MDKLRNNVALEIKELAALKLAPASLAAKILNGAFDADIEESKYASISDIAEMIIDINKIRK